MNYTNIRYSVMLNDTQYEYLSDDHQGISRVKCFHTFLKLAAKEETAVSGKGFSAVLQPGQFIASKVEPGQGLTCVFIPNVSRPRACTYRGLPTE